MVSWVLVCEIQESKVHRRMRKSRTSHFPECTVASVAHLVVSGSGTHSSEGK